MAQKDQPIQFQIMKHLIAILVSVCSILAVQAQDEARDWAREGNELYDAGTYLEATEAYKKALNQSPELIEGYFNLGDALYKQEKYEDAGKLFQTLAANSPDPAMKARAYHNLGNTLLKGKKYQESMEAYKNALRHDPTDEEARYNFEYARQKLIEEQNQQQQDQDDKDNEDDKDKDKDEEKDENKDKENQEDDSEKDQEDKDKDEGDKNEDKDKKEDEPKDQDGDKKDPNDKDQQQQQPQPNKLSKEDAERLLNAQQNAERNTQEKVNEKRAKIPASRIEKDW